MIGLLIIIILYILYKFFIKTNKANTKMLRCYNSRKEEKNLYKNNI